ncbi:MAG TPA: hypothetical protein VFB51_07050 [Solirubrobacterales bacterium]|nr:hypothetical protein [Solirubrobacterales bacterium]
MKALAAAAGALALALVAVGPAQAGIYTVHACGGPGGGTAEAFTPIADPMMDAYSLCPPASGVGTGIVTKAGSSGGRASYGAGAYQVFTAPAGNELVDVTFSVGAIRLAPDWSVGIVAFGHHDWDAGDYPYGCYPWNSYCGIGTPVFSFAATVNLFSHARFRFQTRCVNPAGCDASASPYSPANRGLFSAANVAVRVRDATPPSVAPHHGALWQDGWHRGREEAWTAYTDSSGIMISRLYVDGALHQMQDYRDGSMPAWVRCSFTRARPCVDVVPGGFELHTDKLADGVHRIDVQAVDAAGNAAEAGRSIQVDNTPPVKPEGAALGGGEGWRAVNRFGLRWSNPPGQVAPIVRAHYRLCPAGGADCATGVAAAQDISALDIRVPGPGEWLARVWLEDAAGNVDAARASDVVRLRFDDEAPSAVFAQQDPGDPRVVRVAVSDAGSGPADGTVELRRLGTAAWIDAGGRLAGNTLESHVDDLALPDGIYELRARVRDVAGNEHTGTRRADGTPMRLVLPLRAGGAIALSARRCRTKGRRCRPVRRIRNGTRVHGRLTANGGPVPNVQVTVLSRARTGATFAPLTTLRTDTDGRMSFRAGPGPSRTLRFRWPGTGTVRPASADITVIVPARSSIAVDRRSVRNGDSVTFSGRLLGRPLPEGGKLVDLQVKLRGRWRTFATPRAGPSGRWAYSYRFEATRGLVRYRFRARIRREAAYPYELGHSRTVRVTVRG